MSNGEKQLSNAFSTGGGGGHFEAHVQASFVVLMLTGGFAPCLPCWPIKEIKLQGKIDGFDTDDLIVFVRNQETNETRKLIGQVKRSIGFTKSDKFLPDVIKAAWNDFRKPSGFTKNQDIISLITGPLNKTDAHNVAWLLDQARHTKDVNEFLRNVEEAKFSPSKSSEKLEVFRHHLEVANGNTEITNDDLYSFLNHFHLLGYDLGKESGVILSLLCSHISQFNIDIPEWAWSRTVDIVQCWNQNAGTIVPEKLPEDLRSAFKYKKVESIPSDYVKPETPEAPKVPKEWIDKSQVTPLTVAALLGKWNERSEPDLEIIRRLVDGF